MPNFADFSLLPPLLDALIAEGYTTPTPIQSQAIPFVLAGRDLCGIAQTGTGKTAAFALPILHRLAGRRAAPRRRACRALVLSPTRELASQIADSFRTYGAGLPLSTAEVFGGVPLGAQQRRLAAGVDILVATPGRLLDLIDRGALTLSHVETFVLDEADRMLDLGFIYALKRIAKLVPNNRQTLLFSATMPPAIAALAAQYLIDPVKVAVTPAATTLNESSKALSSCQASASGRYWLPSCETRVLSACWFSPEQSTVPIVSSAIWCLPGSRLPPFTATSRSRNASACWRAFAAAAGACSSPLTLQPEASMSTGCRTSSISSCPTCPKIMSIASAGQHGPAPLASRSRCAATRSARICAASKG